MLAPTRELALQVAEAFSRYGAHLPVNVLPIYGGASYGPQLARPQARRAGRRRHAGPGHRPPREGQPGPHAPRLPGARRGRRDAADGLRRGRRAHPRRHPRVQAGRAVLGDHAARHPQDHHEVPARPRRGHGQVENRNRGEHHAALHPGGRRPQDGCADPAARGRAVRGDDRVRPHQAGHRRSRRETARRGDSPRRPSTATSRRRCASAPSPRSRTESSTS